MSEENQQFAIQKIYLKDVSFESPNSPQAFTNSEWKPEISVQINSSNQTIAENTYEVILDITVTAKHEEKTAFLAEVKQAGIFTIAGFPQENLGGMIGAYCPETLFPFAREAVSELVSKGGFPQLLLVPVNFNALYTQQMQQQAEKVEGATAEDATH
ncbi:Protein-export protein SecB (maintains pre-export unfolded state) [hydrothermal vent metagenome]|uniref:Protein-export protein SecB (Maintains pre-export unfolded state) n=1 Tax=hydrothermal vent metagenome TaxID=652676 RepID=A0A3B0X793_9ZZZZ